MWKKVDGASLFRARMVFKEKKIYINTNKKNSIYCRVPCVNKENTHFCEDSVSDSDVSEILEPAPTKNKFLD